MFSVVQNLILCATGGRSSPVSLVRRGCSGIAVDFALRVAGLAVERLAGMLNRDFADGRAVLIAGKLNPLAAKRIVLALRVAHPIVGHQNPAQIGIAGKANAEHIENLAFREARPRM